MPRYRVNEGEGHQKRLFSNDHFARFGDFAIVSGGVGTFTK